MTAPSIPLSLPAVSLARLMLVELRKAVDTRSGRWLLIVIAIACIGVALLQVTFEKDPTLTGLRGLYVSPARNRARTAPRRRHPARHD